MKISQKLVLGFTSIVVLLVLVLSLSALSSNEIEDQGRTILEQVDVSESEFVEFRKLNTLEESIKVMIQDVLSLGYVSDRENQNSLYEAFEEDLATLRKNAKEASVNEDIKEDLTGIENAVEEVFSHKEDELTYEEKLQKGQERSKEIHKALAAKSSEIESMKQVQQEKIDRFSETFESLKKEYEELRQPTEEEKEEVNAAIREKTNLEALGLFEIEEVWDPAVLDITVKEFSDIIFRTREIFITPEKSADYLKEIEEISDKIISNIEFQVKFGSSVYDAVSSQVITLSLQEYIERLKSLIQIMKEELSLNAEMSKLQQETEQAKQNIDQSRQAAFEIITGTIEETTEKVESIIDQKAVRQTESFQNSFKLIKEKSNSSVTSINDNNFRILIIISISIGLSILIGLIVFYSIRKPINRLLEKTSALRELDFKVAFEDKKKKDELGQLEEALKGIVASVRETLLNVVNAISSVDDSSSELETITTESEDAFRELKEQANNTEQNVQDTSAAIEEVSSGIEEVASSARNITDISNELNEKAKSTSDAAKSGEEELEKVAVIVRDAETQADETSQVVEKLQEQAKNVGEIVKTISGISEQTNLLALNAAIEAARAGEAGKGFAVVADEIRKLAEESQKSTEDISGMLKEIGSGVSDVNSASTKTVDIVKDMNTRAQSALDQFHTILESLSEVTDAVHNLNSTSEEQSAAADEIAGATDQSAQSMVEASEQVQKMVEMVDQQVNSVEKLKESSERLTSLTNELEEGISKFTI